MSSLPQLMYDRPGTFLQHGAMPGLRPRVRRFRPAGALSLHCNVHASKNGGSKQQPQVTITQVSTKGEWLNKRWFEWNI